MIAPVLIAVVVGLALGSVAGAAVTRWPAGRTLGRPARSVCDGCGTVVRTGELVPLLGWIRNRGRCRTCGHRIDVRQVALELAGATAVVGALRTGPVMMVVILGGIGIAVAMAAVLDAAHGWIPDRLTLPLGAAVVPAALAVAVEGSADTRAVLVHGLAVPTALSALRWSSAVVAGRPWFGGGDVKLLVPVMAGAALVPSGPSILWATALGVGGGVATVGLLSGRLRRGSTLPFAPFIACGWSAMLTADAIGRAA